MDIGTVVMHTDADDNTYVGFVVGKDFEMRTVYRSPTGQVRHNPDGTLADKAGSAKDKSTVEKVDTGLFNVQAWHRDGSPVFLVVGPDDLSPVPSFDTPPVFSHVLQDSPASIAGAPAGGAPAPGPDVIAVDQPAAAPALTAADHSAIAAQVVAALKGGA